ncbi:MAG: FtsX-like permease family protein [Hyphomonas sp.]|uniref:ABC transporter permease n=1 Tax=Hyphomonas sp. TaxID=87 RepID=UPI0017F9FFE7|nr:FtsX-like permease family protein [Hyphomonas sp.]MBA3067924.1 FtsX-like permease family protein [Hyphomonas sp.]MBU4061261.1 ABC transporter permease [Alphaproteobacteria bacterium]MBU4162514.1 ABC transporter permease [Alphaproteobacteria bacterium]
MLDRKMLRDFLGMRIQAIAIALVIAGGVSVQLLSSGLVTSLEETRRAYYERNLMADVWAPVVRAPQGVIDSLRQIAGVQAIEGRLRFGIRIDMPASQGPVLGEVISIPESHEPSVNRLHVSMGRLPANGRRDEAVVLKRFAEAHRIGPGDKISFIIRGRQVQVMVTGLVMSPEHVYAIAPGELVPDEKRFGVLWMNERALSELAGWEGAFNEAVLRLSRGASVSGVLGRLDSELAVYGAVGAFDRSDHVSDAFVSSEVDQLRTLGRVVPPVFLGVGAVLVYVVISRLVMVQRPAIGLLKAYGYSDREVLMHFLKLVGLIGSLGLLTGVLLGIWFGREMARLYIRYYDFPFLLFRAAVSDYVVVGAVSALSVLGAGLLAVRASVALNPADAMTPPPPPDYSKAAGIAITRARWIDQQTRMILRQIIRWPGRALVTVGGIAASLALLLSVLVMMDGMERMIASYFSEANRYDAVVTLTEARGPTALHDVRRVPGVLAAEPFRVVTATLRSGPSTERVALIGTSPDSELARLIDSAGKEVRPPPSGLVLSDDLARKLKTGPGDTIELQITEGRRPNEPVEVAALARTYLGSAVLMDITELNRIMGEGAVISGAYLKTDAAQEDRLRTELVQAPGVATVSFLGPAEDRLRALMDENIGVSLTVFALFAAMIALGVVYNSVRISFTERQRELASLRVLGFSKVAVSYILLGEVALLTLLAVPSGIGAGCLLSMYFAEAMGSELFRLPLAFVPATMATASLIVMGTVVLSGLIVRQRIDKIDMVEALKSA